MIIYVSNFHNLLKGVSQYGMSCKVIFNVSVRIQVVC